MANRHRKAIDFFLGFVKDTGVDDSNVALYESILTDMNDEEMSILANRILDDDFVLPIFVENMGSKVVTSKKLMEVGERLGIEFHEQLIITDHLTGITYKTPEKYLILLLPVRRQIQHLVKKRGLTEHTRSTDHLTGQVTGESKGASLTMPELGIMVDKGAVASAVECLKPRAGDKEAELNMMMQLEETGEFNLSAVMDLGSKPKVNETFKGFLLGMGIDSVGLT